MAEEKKKSQVEDINRSIYDVKDKVEYSYKADKGLTEDVIREISREKDEPEWMLEKRLEGYRDFINRPMPQWGVDLKDFDADDFKYYVKPIDKQATTWEELPDEIRAQLDAMLADVNYTYQDIADTITDLGYEISRSAVGRYAMRHNSAARRLKEASEQTTALLQFIRENQDVESTELASAIMIDGLTRRIATADEDFDAMPLDKAGRLLVQLQRSTIYKERWRKERLAAIEAVERNVKARMRQAVQNDPELLAQLQRLVSDAAAEEAGRDEG